MRALQVEVVDRIERRGLHRLDGHRSAKVMVRHVAHLSEPEARRRASAARALRELPEVKAAFSAGRVGACQVDRIARAHSNIRVREGLCRQDRALAALAAMEDFISFDARVTDWVRQADEDGTCDAAQRQHENRDATLLAGFDGSWTLAGGFGSMQGAEMRSIFDRFVDAERLADWEKARAEHGDAATVEHLARTDGQRRADALWQLFQQAASAEAASPGGSVVVTNIVIDQATFERQLRRLAGTTPPPIEVDLSRGAANAPHATDPVGVGVGVGVGGHGAGSDSDEVSSSGDGRGASLAWDDGGRVGASPPSGSQGFRCSTPDGHPVEPTEAVATALVGHVRRVVVGADSVVIDLGRRRRLFTGTAQLAVRLASTHCYWPGCQVPVSACQIDHLIPWADHGGSGDSDGGPTNPGNGGPACGRHNRLKEHGYRVHRDAVGHWHIHRPDGTEIL